MNQCPNCGKPVAENARFCPNCGAAQPSAPPRTVPGQSAGSTQSPYSGQTVYNGRPVSGQSMPSPEKKGGGKVGIILAAMAAVVALIVLGVLFIPRLFRSPEKEFVSCQQEAVVTPLLALIENKEELIPVRKVSTDMTLSLNIDQPDYQQFLEDTSLVLKVDSDGNKLLMNADAILMGSPVLSGSATYEEGRFGFCLPELDENYYVMDLAQLLSWLSGEQVELGEAKLPEASGKEWAALARAYVDLVSTAVTKENVTLEKRAQFTLSELGETYTGDVYTFTPTAADVTAVLNQLADHLEQDKDLRSLILKLVDEETLLEAMDSRYSSLNEALTDAANALRGSAVEAGRAVEESGFTWKLYMEGKTIRMISWKANQGAAAWEQGGTHKDAIQVFYVQPSGSSREVVYRHTYTKDDNNSQGNLTFGADGSAITLDYSKNGSRYEGTAKLVSAEGRFDVTYSMDREKRSALGFPYGSYEISQSGGDITLSLRVEDGPSGTADHVITVEGPALAQSEGFSRVEVTINTTDKGTAKAPAQTPVDVTNWSEDQLEELWNGLGYKLYGQFIGQVGSLFYGA